MPVRQYREFLPIIFNTILALSVLYAPQPLLPSLSREFAVSREAAAALTTVTFIPLALAPLFYGYLLETISPVRILKLAISTLAISEVAFALTTNFPLLILIRLFQGLLVPAILTSLMTYLSSRAGGDRIQRTMAIYIAATIFGGFIGRAMSGIIASWLGWRFSFVALAITLAMGFVLLFALPESVPPVNKNRLRPHALIEVLCKPAFLPIYLSIFCLFFVFAAVMNFLPFRLTELSPAANEMKIGLMYSGYMMGILTSLGAPRINTWLKGEVHSIRLGLLALALTLIGLASPQIGLLFAMVFLFCGAMFLVHATASGLVNRLAGSDRRGLTNGLYVAFYYAGGSIGSFAPGIVYRDYGWNGFLLLLIAICVTGFLAMHRVPRHLGSAADWKTRA